MIYLIIIIMEYRRVKYNRLILILLSTIFLLFSFNPVFAGYIGGEVSLNTAGPFHAMTSTWRYGSADTGKEFVIAGEKEGRGGGWGITILSVDLSSKKSVGGSAGKMIGDVEHHVADPVSIMVVSPGSGGVEAVMFDDSGGSINSFSLPIVSGSGYFSCSPSAYSNSSYFLVVWEERKTSSSSKNKQCSTGVRGSIFSGLRDDLDQANIAAALVTTSGSIVKSFLISSISGVLQLVPGVSSRYTVSDPSNDDFLVVWSRFTSSDFLLPGQPSTGSPTSTQSEFPVLYGARVDANGNLLDADAIRIVPFNIDTNEPDLTSPQWDPRVEWGGDHYLVVWDEGGLAGFNFGGEAAVSGSRIEITPTGLTNHDPRGFKIGHLRGSGAFDPDVAWNGLYFYVVWADMRNDPDVRDIIFQATASTSFNTNNISNGSLKDLDLDIYGARVISSLSSAEVIDPDGQLLHRDGGQPDYNPVVAWNGTDFAAFWTDHMVARFRGPKTAVKRFNFYYNIHPTVLPRAKVNQPYFQQLQVAECFNPPGNPDCLNTTFTWSVDESDWDGDGSGNNNILSNAGVSLDSTTGIISGTPSQSNEGSYLIRVTASDNSSSDSDFREYRLIIGEPASELPEGCMIATAAYGSFLHPYVTLLREMRDRYLLPYRWGRSIMRFYYRTSPSIAEIISRHAITRYIVRGILIPVVLMAGFMVKTTMTQKIIVFVLFISAGVYYCLRRFNKGGLI
ncbi:MAG: Ig domain-containing protein [Nitrospirota bacterium]